MKILVIDDSEMVREFFTRFFMELSFDTVEACDGEDALQKLDKHSPFDAVVVDWDMPVMDGLDFIKAVRALPEYLHLKILMVTAQSGYNLEVQASEAGANGFIKKPLSLEMLEQKLQMIGLTE